MPKGIPRSGLRGRPAQKTVVFSEPKNPSENRLADSDPPSTEEKPEEIGSTDKKIGFFSDETVSEIRWDRFKSEKNRLLVKQLIKNEAEKMGFFEKVAENPETFGMGVEEIFGVYNAMAVGAVTAVTHCPPKIAGVLAFSEQEIDTINVRGAADRICRKYLSTDFAYFDEIIVSLALLPILYTKFQMFKYLMAQWKNQPREQPKNVTPIRPTAPQETADIQPPEKQNENTGG